MPNITRWNSRYNAMKCTRDLLNDRLERLEEFCMRQKLQALRRPVDVDFVGEYCQVSGNSSASLCTESHFVKCPLMKPLADALDILRGDKNMYLGYPLPTVAALKRKLTSLRGVEYCEPLKTAVIAGLEKR